jgi:AcrR family transcriptional regulator
MSPRPSVEAQRRDEVLSATCERLSEVGFNQVRVADIADRIGISTGIIHYYFGTKKELLDAAFQYAVARARVRSLEALEKANDPWEQLVAVVDAQLPSRGAPREWLIWMHMWAESVVRPELRHLNNASYPQWIDLVETIVQEGQRSGEFRSINAREFTMQFLTMMDGMVIQQTLQLAGFTPPKVRKLLLAFAKNSLLEPR